mmetsp:Transcript_9131/g.8736  ORF Transcript_9131/g.8736 Transcript_9131/m.8736 type:complete len:523 (-) Transcript_9131:82-1650(-)
MTSIRRDSDFKSMGYAFVRFTKKENALRAAENHSNLEINGVKLECSKFERKQSKENKEVVSESASFSNLPTMYTEETAKELFSQYGTVTSLTIDENDRTGTVSFSTFGSVNKAIQSMNGRKFEDASGVADSTQPAFIITDNKKKGSVYNNLYIGNIDPKTTDEEIKAEFSSYGEIESMLRPTRKITTYDGVTKDINKNYIYISFKDSKVASTVIKELDGRVRWGRELNIDFYDPNKKKHNQAKNKSAQDTATFEQMTQSLFSALAAVASQVGGGNYGRGRGGYGGSNHGYRGNNYGRGRGGRGSNRGRGGRGRGGPTGGGYQARAQYDRPVMGQAMPPMMGAPPMGAPPMGAPPMGAPSMGAPPMGAPPMGAPPMGGAPAGPPPVGMPGAGAPPSSHPSTGAQFGFDNNQPSMGSNQMAPPTTQPSSQSSHTPSEPAQEKTIEGYNLEQIEQLPQEERENLIGTYLYNKLEPLRGGDIAGKITGMFLDLPLTELFDISTDEATFDKYLKDAHDLIENESKED